MNYKFVDFPKINCPFVRKINEHGHYVVTDELTEGYEWVFNDDSVMAIEKLHGTCCAVVIENGGVSALFNRTKRVPFIGGTLSKAFTEGVNNAVNKKRLLMIDGIHWGELLGPKIQKNDYSLKEHEWIPFETYAQKHLAYTSWGKYPKDFESMSEWFKTLMPLFSNRIHGRDMEDQFVEGIVFTHPDGRYAKLRCDMFSGYKGRRHKGRQLTVEVYDEVDLIDTNLPKSLDLEKGGTP